MTLVRVGYCLPIPIQRGVKYQQTWAYSYRLFGIFTQRLRGYTRAMSLPMCGARVRVCGVRFTAIAAVLYSSSMLFAQSGALGSQSILPDYTHGPGWFPGVIKPYRQAPGPDRLHS